MEREERGSLTCPSCRGSDARTTRVRSAFWHDGRLVVVEDIPALECAACGEQSYEDSAVVVLDLLRGQGFPAEKARDELRVPVFSFLDGVGAEGKR